MNDPSWVWGADGGGSKSSPEETAQMLLILTKHLLFGRVKKEKFPD